VAAIACGGCGRETGLAGLGEKTPKSPKTSAAFQQQIPRLEKLDPQIIVIGEAPSRHLNYYTGYTIITQNGAGDITMDCEGNKVHLYVSDGNYTPNNRLAKILQNEGRVSSPGHHYIGSLTVEIEYTL
jgi:hypothetical protein